MNVDPFDLMPALKRSHPISWITDKIENKWDSKAIAAWLALAGAALAATVGIVVSVGKALTSSALLQYARLHPNASLVFVASISTYVALSLVSFVRKRRWDERLRKADTLSQFNILQMVTMGHIKSPHRIDYCHRYWIQSRVDGATTFDMGFVWSSDDEALAIKLKNPKHSYRLEDTSRIGAKRLVIDLGGPLNRGHKDVVAFTFAADTVGRREPMPFLSLSMVSNKFPRFNTFIAVVFSESVAIASLYRESYFSVLTDTPIERHNVRLDSSPKLHIWPVPVRAGWKARLNWVYASAEV